MHVFMLIVFAEIQKAAQLPRFKKTGLMDIIFCSGDLRLLKYHQESRPNKLKEFPSCFRSRSLNHFWSRFAGYKTSNTRSPLPCHGVCTGKASVCNNLQLKLN